MKMTDITRNKIIELIALSSHSGDKKPLNLYGLNIVEVDFSNLDFSNCNFENTKISNSTFRNCNFKGANFSNSKLIKTNFSGSIFDFVTFNLKECEDNNFTFSSFQDADVLSLSICEKNNFYGSNFTNTDKKQSSLTLWHNPESEIKSKNLEKIEVKNIDFYCISYFDFYFSEFDNCTFEQEIENCTFRGIMFHCSINGKFKSCLFESFRFDECTFYPFYFEDCIFENFRLYHPYKDNLERRFKPVNGEFKGTLEITYTTLDGLDFSHCKGSLDDLDLVEVYAKDWQQVIDSGLRELFANFDSTYTLNGEPKNPFQLNEHSYFLLEKIG
jgi:uncharacterized protein YjbI with pentapeptide repeats